MIFKRTFNFPKYLFGSKLTLTTKERNETEVGVTHSRLVSRGLVSL